MSKVYYFSENQVDFAISGTKHVLYNLSIADNIVSLLKKTTHRFGLWFQSRIQNDFSYVFPVLHFLHCLSHLNIE